jgi:hypothetical protein
MNLTSIKKIRKFIAENKGIKAVNEYTEEGVDLFYLMKDSSVLQKIPEWQYESLKSVKHDTNLIGANICEMIFN